MVWTMLILQEVIPVHEMTCKLETDNYKIFVTMYKMYSMTLNWACPNVWHFSHIKNELFHL